MGVEKIVDLAVQYGIFGAMLVYMIVVFTRLSNRLINVIEKNSETMGEVSAAIQKCKK